MPTKVSEMKVTKMTETTMEKLRRRPFATSDQIRENLIEQAPHSDHRCRCSWHAVEPEDPVGAEHHRPLSAARLLADPRAPERRPRYLDPPQHPRAHGADRGARQGDVLLAVVNCLKAGAHRILWGPTGPTDSSIADQCRASSALTNNTLFSR